MNTFLNQKSLSVICRASSCLALSLLLASCIGSSSNPLAAYSELKSAQPTGKTSESQLIVPEVFTPLTVLEDAEVMSLNLQGTQGGSISPQGSNKNQFLEEQEKTFFFKVLPKSQKITKYSLQISDIFLGTQPLPVKPEIKETTVPNVFSLTWKAPFGTIPNGELFVLLEAKIQVTVLEATSPHLVGLTKLESLPIVLTRDNSVPLLTVEHSSLESGIDEGKILDFEVDLEDPGSILSPKIPLLQVAAHPYTNTEAFRADGSSFVSLKCSQKAGSSCDPNFINPKRFVDNPKKWKFYLQINADKLPLDKDRRGIDNPLSPEVDLCFNLRAISVLNTYSPEQQICLKARYAAQAPVLKWEDENQIKLTAGELNVIKFKISSANDLGKVDITNPEKQLSLISGSKKLECRPETPEKLTSQVCELSWTPTCLQKDSLKKLSLKVDNLTGSKSKSATFSKDFTLIPSQTACLKKGGTHEKN